MKKKIIIILTLISLIAVFKIFNVEDYLSLSYLKESQDKFESLYTENQFAVIAGYMAIYILMTSLSLPGAVVLGLAAGAFFGLLTGTIVVSFASTIGATLACLVSRCH